MVYRDFGTLDRPVSLLGFGCMRLPTESTPEPGESYEYQVPDAAATDMSYGFTLPPTATPSPTPPPLDLSVEED